MAANLYDLAREGILKGDFTLLGSDIKAALVTSAYTRNLTTDKFMSAITSGYILARSANLGGKSVVLGVFDANDTLFPSVPAGTGHQVVIYADIGGSDAARRLIANWDGGTGLDITTNGNDVNLIWSNGADKIFNWKQA